MEPKKNNSSPKQSSTFILDSVFLKNALIVNIHFKICAVVQGVDNLIIISFYHFLKIRVAVGRYLLKRI
jgi:hypothetical protein